jgi:DNA-directed RNA polymerase specialized sigma24 family protein
MAPGRLGEVFAALADGDASALEPLYDALAEDIHALAPWRTGSPAEAADVLQEVFVRLAQAGPRLRLARARELSPELREVLWLLP